MAEVFLTVGAAAERLNCTVKWVYKLLGQKRLRYEKFGAVYQIYATSVDTFRPGPRGRPPGEPKEEPSVLEARIKLARPFDEAADQCGSAVGWQLPDTQG